MTEKTVPDKPGKKSYPAWLLYIAILLSGLLFLAEAAHIYTLQRIPAKLAIALIFSAVALIVGKGRPIGYISAGIVCLTVIVLFFL